MQRAPAGTGRQRRSFPGKSQLLSMAEALSRLIPNADSCVISVIRHRQLALLESTVAEGTDLTRNRVGLRNQVARLIDLAEYHGILAIFHSQDSKDYRFTFAARESAFDA